MRSFFESRIWRWISRWWQMLLGILLVVLLVFQVQSYGNLSDWWTQFQLATSTMGWWYLLLTLLLVPLNWTLESFKWYVLLRHWWPELKVSSVVRAVLAGIAVSLLTPNRIGEYGGRALLFPLSRTTEVVLSSLLGSWCQWLVFVGLGWPALTYEFRDGLNELGIWWGNVALIVPCLLLLLLAKGGFLLATLIRWTGGTRLASVRLWRWLRIKLLPLQRVSRQAFIQALSLALLRFLTYSTQYLLLLWFFGLPLSVLEGMLGIFSIYLIQAGIPLPPGLGVMTRSEIAMLVWNGVEIHPLSVISATFTIYVLNLLLPALPGIWLIVKIKKTNPRNNANPKS